MEREWATGEAVVIREVWAGTIFEARPCLVVEDRPWQTTLFVPRGTSYAIPLGDDGVERRLPVGPWRLSTRPAGFSVLSFAWPQTPYAVLLRWGPGRSAPEWYVNLQAPLARTGVGFDTTDHVLDVVIDADRSGWTWKDEDELAEAVSLGLFTSEEAAWFRWWGERAVEHVLLRQPPFDLGWETWAPNPAWPLPELPPGWDRPPQTA